MKLKVYADRMSQPSRAVILFCKLNGIEFDEIRVDLSKHQQLNPEFKEVNPLGQVPAIVDGKLKLFESHAILVYLSCAFPGVADHWYPADLSMRARIHSVLDWHHLNLRRGAAGFVFNSVFAPLLGFPKNPKVAAEAKKVLSSSLSKIETIWLEEGRPFLLGARKPSIADISFVCEIMQLELVDEEIRTAILGPHKKVQQWIEQTRNATQPYFDEVHKVLYKKKTMLQNQNSDETGSSTKKLNPPSKL